MIVTLGGHYLTIHGQGRMPSAIMVIMRSTTCSNKQYRDIDEDSIRPTST